MKLYESGIGVQLKRAAKSFTIIGLSLSIYMHIAAVLQIHTKEDFNNELMHMYVYAYSPGIEIDSPLPT